MRHLRSEQIEGSLQALSHIEGDLLELQFAGFYFRKVQDVVDDGQERVATGANDLGKVALLGAQTGVQQQPAHADDGVHRGANLVAHGGQERALGMGGI